MGDDLEIDPHRIVRPRKVGELGEALAGTDVENAPVADQEGMTLADERLHLAEVLQCCTNPLGDVARVQSVQVPRFPGGPPDPSNLAAVRPGIFHLEMLGARSSADVEFSLSSVLTAATSSSERK